METLPRLVGICGRRRSGKDTIAEILCRSYGYHNAKIADDLKQIVKLLFGFSESQVESDAKDVIDERWGIAPRKAMQWFGTETMQFRIPELIPDIGRTFWIKSFINKNVVGNDKLVVVSDVRFLHEYEELKKHGVYMIRVDRELTNVSECDGHISEIEYTQIPVDVVIDNNGSLDDLRRNLLRAFSQI